MIRASLSISCIKTNRLESRPIDVPRLSLPHTLCNTYIISEVIIFFALKFADQKLKLKDNSKYDFCRFNLVSFS